MGRLIDERGNVYGRLTVLERAENDSGGNVCWRCLCECGKKTEVRGEYLRSGHTRSCGCLQRDLSSEALLKDEAGQRYGSLTVIERAENNSHGAACWRCICDCGEETVVVRGSSLRGGLTKSCGCISLLKDETGQRFGRWTVLKRAEDGSHGNTRWCCVCDCGEEKIVPGNRLRRGTSKSCGCLSREQSSEQFLKDETGKRFGRWTVIERAENTKQGQAQWECRCDCGESAVVTGSHLRSGKSSSCGCLKREQARDRSTIHGLYGTPEYWAMQHAKRRVCKEENGIDDFTVDELERWLGLTVGNQCAYCGATEDLTLEHIRPVSRGGRHTLGNLTRACSSCNYSKGAKLTIEWSAR